MAVKKFYVTKPKEGYQYDRAKGKYFSWGYDIWIDRRRESKCGFYTKDRAEDAVKVLKEDHQNSLLGIVPRSKSPYLIELFQKKLDSLITGQERSRSKRVFKEFLALVPDRIRVVELKKAHLKLYQDKRSADGVKNATIKREMVPLIEVLNNADQYYPELDSYRPPKRPRLPIPKTRKTITIKHDERRELLKYLLAPQSVTERPLVFKRRRRVGQFLQMCLLTVSRPGEIARIRLSDVDWHAGFLTIHGTKTQNKQHSDRLIPITPTIKAILEDRIAAGNEYLFTKNGDVTDRMREILRDACISCGIKYGRNDPDGITLYTARHTATTVLQHSNRVDLKTTGDFTGHSDEVMTMYYSHSNPETLKIASEILEEEMGQGLLDSEFLESFKKAAS